MYMFCVRICFAVILLLPDTLSFIRRANWKILVIITRIKTTNDESFIRSRVALKRVFKYQGKNAGNKYQDSIKEAAYAFLI